MKRYEYFRWIMVICGLSNTLVWPSARWNWDICDKSAEPWFKERSRALDMRSCARNCWHSSCDFCSRDSSSWRPLSEFTLGLFFICFALHNAITATRSHHHFSIHLLRECQTTEREYLEPAISGYIWVSEWFRRELYTSFCSRVFHPI